MTVIGCYRHTGLGGVVTGRAREGLTEMEYGGRMDGGEEGEIMVKRDRSSGKGRDQWDRRIYRGEER